MLITARIHSNLVTAQTTLSEISHRRAKKAKSKATISYKCRIGQHGSCNSKNCICPDCQCAINREFLLDKNPRISV